MKALLLLFAVSAALYVLLWKAYRKLDVDDDDAVLDTEYFSMLLSKYHPMTNTQSGNTFQQIDYRHGPYTITLRVEVHFYAPTDWEDEGGRDFLIFFMRTLL